jgi:hypothetical protein
MGEKLMNGLVVFAVAAVIFFCCCIGSAYASIDEDLKNSRMAIEFEVAVHGLDGDIIWSFYKIDEWLEYIKRQLQPTINADEL